MNGQVHRKPRLFQGKPWAYPWPYGHLTPDYLRAEINRLPGAPPPEQEPSSAVAVAV